jgi:hypothetical protein
LTNDTHTGLPWAAGLCGSRKKQAQNLLCQISSYHERGNWTEKVLHYFGSNQEDGNNPAGTLIFDAAGNLYGTTTFGGAFGSKCGSSYNCGPVFELSPGGSTTSWTEKMLYRFNEADGAFPLAGLILDSAGNLYGDASSGGFFRYTCGLYFDQGVCGAVFEITP